VVDPAYAKVRPSWQQFLQGEFHAICRGPAAAVFLRGAIFRIDNHLFGIQGTVYGNGVSHPGLGTVRSHDHHIAQSPHITDEVPQSGSGNSIIIGNQNEGFGHRLYFIWQKYVFHKIGLRAVRINKKLMANFRTGMVFSVI
jgi:hypothetical protein